MKYLVAAALVLAAAQATFAEGAAEDDMTVDPVCLMNISKSKVEYSESFQGEQYWFCNQNCWKQFKETPDKFAAAVQKVRKTSYLVKYFTRPAKIYSNTDTQIFFNVERNPGFKETAGWKPKSLSAECEMMAEVGGGKTQTIPSKLTFRPMKEEGWFRADARYLYPGRLKIKIRVTFDDGEYDEAEFKLPVVLGAEGETGSEYDGKRMDMIIQHETMRKTGKYWTIAGEELRKDTKEGLEAGKKAFQMVKSYQKYIDQMVPHVFEDELDQWKQLNAEYLKALNEMEGVLNQNDPAKAVEAWEKLDALHCTECHMKFRWSIFADPKNYPVVGGDGK